MILPIDSVLPDLLAVLRDRQAAVLQAPPGAGKTTRVPLVLVDEPWLSGRKVVMLEPRRLAARAAARYMAARLGEPTGATVGYRTRMDSRVGPETRVEVVTEGVLTRLLQDDPVLEGYGAVIFDEFHERSLQADLGLALAQEVREALRPDLRLVVMSATLDGGPVARLLGDAPLIGSEGRGYPVTVRYHPPEGRDPDAHMLGTLRRVLADESSGSVLAFLPGGAEIRRLDRLLRPQLPDDAFVAPLYGELPQADQDRAIAPAPAGRRKIVLATTLAETSLTIEGIRAVVDSGLARRPRFDPVSGMTRLVTVRVSQAASEQRKGRAGRLAPGVCHRLWGEAEQSRLQDYTPPEIIDADLIGLALELARWGVSDPAGLKWLDRPPAAAFAQARDLLGRLGALDAQGRITAHGRALQALGLHPRLGHMVLSGERLGWGRAACELAGLLSERDVYQGVDARRVDLTERLAALRSRDSRAVRGRLERVKATAAALRSRLGTGDRPETPTTPGILLGFAYPDRVAQRRPGSRPRYLLANGRGAFLPDDDSMRDAPYLVAASLDGGTREAKIFQAAALNHDDIETHFGSAMAERRSVRWDGAAQAVAAIRARCYGALVLEESTLDGVPGQEVAAALLEGVRRKGMGCLPWTDALRQWQARVRFMRRIEGDRWPDLSDEALARTAESWFIPFAGGMTRLSHLRDFPLRRALETLLCYDRRAVLDQQAPPAVTVPSGSRITIDYRAGESPILAVKLQEMFGVAETPSVGQGRVPLVLHLLSPARRPVQITRDLAGFWRDSYHQVRRELRGRYPKHPWPEDPLAAVATRHAKTRR